MDRNRRFDNKVIVITGGGRGLGRAAALGFAREGGAVVVRATSTSTCPSDGRRDRASGGSALSCPVTFAPRAVKRSSTPLSSDSAASTCSTTMPASSATAPSRSSERGRLGLPARHQSQGHVPDLQVRHSRDAQARRRRHRQHRLRPGVCLAEDRAAYAASKGGVVSFTTTIALDHARRQHPLQLHRARFDPDADARGRGGHLRRRRPGGRDRRNGDASIRSGGSAARKRSPISSSSWPATRPRSAPAAATGSTVGCCRRCSTVRELEPDMTGPLNGLVVADFAQLAQGPFATQMLGDMGAEIIKIEPPKATGCATGAWPTCSVEGESVSFLSFNRNKRSIALDLKHPARQGSRPAG